MQGVARHVEPDRGLQALDQLELDRRGRRGPRARPVDADAARGRAAREGLPDWVDAEGKGNVGPVAALRPGAVEAARERLQPDLHVAVAARIEERLPGDAARAPVLGDAVVARVAELAVELRIRQR